jgi:hypothetical protein
VHLFDMVANVYFLVPHREQKKRCLNVGSRFYTEFQRVGIVKVQM